MTRDDYARAYEYWTGGSPETSGAPCCPWGSHADDWTVAAYGVALVAADGPLTEDDLDAAASTVVNCGDVEAWRLHDFAPDDIPEPIYDRPDGFDYPDRLED